MPLLGSIHWHVNILLHLMVVFVACVNGFHGGKPNIVYICKQECLWIGCEHQYKQSSLNMSNNRVGNNQLSPFITLGIYSSLKVCKENLFILYPASTVGLFWNQSQLEALPRADCMMSWPLITAPDFRGAGRAAGLSVLSMPLHRTESA